MILDCPACGAALVYDPETGKMKCDSCSNLFETFELQEDYLRRGERELNNTTATIDNSGDNVSFFANTINKQKTFNPESSFDNPIYDHSSDSNEELAITTEQTADTMKCNIYSCTACGAEILVNEVEVSTFCSYCGQPTLVFSRIAFTKKPKYIIPFSVTKDKAVSLIKEQFDKGFFVPDDIRNLKPERVRGIYIPYWLYNIHYDDSVLLHGTVGSGKNSQVYNYYRKAECNFEHLAMEASEQLDDTLSRKLNPYYTNYMKEFSPEYLSGYYADHYSTDTDKLKGQAILRAQATFDNEIKRSVAASSVGIIKKNPSFEITDTEYAMFPAWFLTFINDGTPYTLLVNGQTEKVIGSVPYDKKKAINIFFLLGIMISFIIWCIIYPILLANKQTLYFTFTPLLWLTFLTVTPIYAGINNLKEIKASRKLSALSETNKYVKNRQGDN